MPRLGERPTVFSEVQCTAKSKRSGKRCRNYACEGRGTCRMHGGKSRRGREHPSYRSGHYSKDTKDAGVLLGRILKRPILISIALYPESLEERLERCAAGQRLVPSCYYASASFPNDRLPLDEQLRMLRAARRALDSRLREVQETIRSMENESPQAAEDTGPD